MRVYAFVHVHIFVHVCVRACAYVCVCVYVCIVHVSAFVNIPACSYGCTNADGCSQACKRRTHRLHQLALSVGDFPPFLPLQLLELLLVLERVQTPLAQPRVLALKIQMGIQDSKLFIVSRDTPHTRFFKLPPLPYVWPSSPTLPKEKREDRSESRCQKRR